MEGGFEGGLEVVGGGEEDHSLIFHQGFEEVVSFLLQIFVLFRNAVDFFQNGRLLIFLGVDLGDNQKTAVGNFIEIALKQIVEAIGDIDEGTAPGRQEGGQLNDEDDAGDGADLEHFCVGVGVEDALVGAFGVDEAGGVVEEDVVEEGVEIGHLCA